MKVIRRDSRQPTQPEPATGTLFIAPERLAELRRCKSANLDFSKLIRLCEEINTCYGQGCFYAVLMLIRAVMDHVPQAFGLPTFNAVADNYSGVKSFKDSMQHLNGSARKIADSYLHLGMRNSETLPLANQVQFQPDVDVLLAEIIRITPKS